MSMPAVLLFAKGFTPDIGGLETYGEDLARSFSRLGLRVYVITQFDGRMGLSRRGRILVWNVGPGPQWRVLVRMLRAARVLLHRRRFLFSYSTTWRVAVAAIFSLTPRPLGITIHGREVLVPHSVLKRLMRWVLGHADQVFSVSDYTLLKAKERGVIASEKGVRNWNGITEQPESQSTASEVDARPRETTGVFTICRLVPRKNIAAGVHAAARLMQCRPEIKFRYRIAGDGESREEIQQTIDEHHLSKLVTLEGRVSDAERDQLYAASDIFLHPQVALNDGQDVEGFGLVIAEAMSRGLAVIVGRDGGTADFVCTGETGMVVDGNDIDAIADALLELINDPEKRVRIAKSGQVWVRENLSWTRHAELILEKLGIDIDNQST